ncbi:unnamed protein product [Agarophyton chilense]
MAHSSEISPLLPTSSNPIGIRNRDKKFVFDEPQSPTCPRLKECMLSTLSPSGHGHPMYHHLQSSTLLGQIECALQKGLHHIVHKLRLMQFFPKSEGSNHEVDSTRSVNFTSPTNIKPYVTASAIASAVPIASNIIFGRVASSIGPANALTVVALTAAIGMGLILVIRSTLLVFFIGYGLYSASNSMRIIRLSMLSQIVPENKRTTVLATHALMTPIGALIGPIVWIFFSRFQGSLEYGSFIVDRFSMTYFSAFAILMFIAVLSALTLQKVHVIEGNQSKRGFQEPRQVTIHAQDGTDTTVNINQFRSRVFAYFCTVMLCVNMSSGIYMTALQPVLVNEFRVSDAKLGYVFELIAAFAIIPPLLVAFLSRYLMDREIMVIGLGSKLVGMFLFLPLFGPVREWQVIIGFMLIIKASIFFSTASMSLFTKVLRSLSSSALIGLLASGSSVGPAIAQLLVSDHIVQFFGGFKFALFSVPAIIGLLMILWPQYWNRLNPNCDFVRQINEQSIAARRLFESNMDQDDTKDDEN